MPTPEELAESIRARAENTAKKLSKDASASIVFSDDNLIYVAVHLRKPGMATREGPAAPNEFWFRGQCVEIGPKPWKLLYVLWTEGRIDVPTLYERVWGMGPVKRLNLRAAVHRANEALNRLCERRLIVQLDDDTISLEGIGLDWGERVA
jgi:hypothetical protein